MSDAQKTPQEYLADHVGELARIAIEGVEGKTLRGLVTLACYDDGTYYPHASGLLDHARALGVLQTFMFSVTLGEHQRWVERAIERRMLERGL